MSKKLKIAFLNIYQGVISRGMETYVLELANRLSLKHEVDVYQSGSEVQHIGFNSKVFPANWDWKRKDSTGTLTRRFFIDYWSIKILFWSLKIAPIIYKEKYDIVIPLNGGWQSVIVRIITWLCGGKMVVSAQSGKGWDDRINLWCFPDFFVALSTHVLNWARHVNPFVKSEFIPNGVDTKKFQYSKFKIQINEKSKTIIAVGAFVPAKRLDLTIKAVSKLKNYRLILAGSGGDLKSELNNLGNKLLGEERFEMISVPYDKMPEVYRKAYVFTLPSSQSEAFGNVIVEAMASGLPVVCTDDPIRREIVGNAGLFVDPTNIDSYAEALKTAMNTDWEDKPQNQAKRFSWDGIALDYEKLFNKLIS